MMQDPCPPRSLTLYMPCCAQHVSQELGPSPSFLSLQVNKQYEMMGEPTASCGHNIKLPAHLLSKAHDGRSLPHGCPRLAGVPPKAPSTPELLLPLVPGMTPETVHYPQAVVAAAAAAAAAAAGGLRVQWDWPVGLSKLPLAPGDLRVWLVPLHIKTSSAPLKFFNSLFCCYFLSHICTSIVCMCLLFPLVSWPELH